MKSTLRLLVALVLIGAGCGAAERARGRSYFVRVDQNPELEQEPRHVRRDAAVLDASVMPASREGTNALGGNHSDVAVAADAGIDSAELAWLVAHIGNDPDRANSADGPNVRALAARGAAGVRAVVQIFRHADAGRVPFARRVFERVALESCRRAGREAALRLVLWLELGRLPEGVLSDAGFFTWTRADDEMWPREAVARVMAWADAGLPCGPPRGFDGGLPSASALSEEDTAPHISIDAPP